ncbi:hypothetical protein CPC08DRAFT_475077 [Agrocybe pediades]|nr:hypothetical protein CPC08DRAFT_475077 [Agrocybe pediades]
MSVQQQSSDSSHDVNPGDARHAPTSQVQDPSSKGSSSKAAYPHLQPLRRPGFLTRSFAPALINISHSIVSGGTFNQQEWAGFAHLLENVATAALYDSIRVIDPPKCYPNTRVAIIQTIIDWTLGKAGEELSEKPILWLKGGAGAGKSAIARSVAERCSDDGLLLGTFCFGAADTTRNHVGRLVATIAYQMCRILPELRKIVTSLIEDDPLVFSRSIGSQFADLITRPLSAVLANRPTGSSAAPRLIIIDGLDECSSIDSQRELLFTLRETIHTTSLIQFLVCSRPERDLNRIFSRPRMVSILHKIFLDNDYSAREDIRIYFEDKFRQIKEGHAFKDKLPYLWPTREMVDTLVDNSSGQFIYAATVVRYVESPRHRPDQRLDAIFNLRPPFEDLPFRELDALYRHIISKAEDLPIVLDIIAFPALYGRFNAEDIEAILQLEQGSVEVLLVDLHSIVTISDGYVKVLYKSLEDFLSEPQRAGDLYRDLSRARLSHIARIISIFSTLDARQAGHVCMDIPIMDVLEELKNSENMKADYVSSDILQASKQFPIFKFFKPLLLYGRTEQEFRISFPSLDSAWHFIPRYFHYLFYIKDVSESTWTVYWDQMRQYCECVLSVLDDNWSDNWKAHFVYAYYHLLQDPRYGLPRVISHVDLSDIDAGAFGDTILHVLGPSHMDSPYPYSDDIVKISHSLIGDIKKEQIFAMSARFCLAFLCAEWMTRRDAVRIDGIAGHARHKKREHPWHWRHMVPSRRSLNLGNRLVLIALRENLQQEYKVTLTSMSSLNRPYLDAHIRVITMREYSEVKSKPVPNKSSSLMDYKDHQRWPLYIFLLDLLPYILPLSGRYEPLLTMCRQRCFSSLSQFWPKKSVRARQAIEGYLRRMDSEERSE